MKKEKISYSQLFYTVICYIQSFSLLMSFSFSLSGKDTWFAYLLGSAFAFIFLLINLAVMRYFPGKNLIQINEQLYGKKVGKIISILYLSYFFILSSLNLRDMNNFVGLDILPETPTLVILISFILVCGWAVTKGIKVIVRYSTAFAWITFISFALTSILVSGRMNWHNFLPMFTTSPQKLLQSANIVSVVPLGMIVFQMIAPVMDQPDKLSKCFKISFWVGSVFLVMVSLRDTAVLGVMAQFLATPSYATLRLAGFSEAFQGLDIVYAVLLIMLEFFKVSILYYALTAGITQLLQKKSWAKPLIVILGVLIIIFSRILFQSVSAQVAAVQNVERWVWLLFELVLPLISLLRIQLVLKKRESCA
ncbi:MAG: spore germination protein [Oscillospiraceae bacterium]|jgi:spore germination protein KB|nr:spore germination protein [Oscillospiraceae bacterium]MDD3261770.1 endospore germination permease [Oscillospiraceae bacterium]